MRRTVIVDLDVRIRAGVEARGARILNADLANLDALRAICASVVPWEGIAR